MPVRGRKPGDVYGRSKGRAPGSKQWYRPTWTAASWNEFVETRAVGVVFQVCAGGSRLGVVRCDMDPEAPGGNVRADFHALPLPDASCDTVVCDPPYSLLNPDRVHLQRELIRVARQRILFKAPWIPRGAGVELLEAVLLGSHTCANVAVLSVLRIDRPLRMDLSA